MLIKIDENEKNDKQYLSHWRKSKSLFFLIEDGLYGVFIQSRNQYESKFMTGD